MIQNFRYYLLIRMRYTYYQDVYQFLERYKEMYQKSKDTNQRLHEATIDIINQYTTYNIESKQWEEWLTSVFQDNSLDGLNRYFAIVRLSFMYFNYKEYTKLIQIYDELDKIFQKGMFYSRRILGNYYGNRLLLHSRFDELTKAEEYGYLSIRQKNTDYLFYLNNLCAVLLRQKKNKDALDLMKQGFTEYKTTMNHHSKIGFVAFYIRSLNKNNEPAKGESYAETFFELNKKQIFEHRWHTFFTSYFQSLIFQEKYMKLLTISKRYKIMDKEKQFSRRAGYIPYIAWFQAIAEYKENRINEQKLCETLVKTSYQSILDKHYAHQINELIEELQPHYPELFKKVKAELFSL